MGLFWSWFRGPHATLLLSHERGSESGPCPCPVTFQHLHRLGILLGGVVDHGHCGVSIGNTKVTHLVFADGTVILLASLEALVMNLRPMRKAHVLGSLLDERVASSYVWQGNRDPGNF